MKFTTVFLLGIAVAAAFAPAYAEDKKEKDTVTLYQIGKDGNYCLSTTPSEGGCISGVGDNGSTVNVLDFIKGKEVVFENLSDSPHDMKFSGNNAEDLPAQAPNGSAVQKEMANVDNDNQKITCSYHGDQLAVGYRVPDRAETKGPEEELEGHGRKPGTESGSSSADSQIAPARPVVNTGLADVSKQVMAKGRPADVEKLVAKRPELMKELEQVRPMLAQEIADRNPGIVMLGANPVLAKTGGNMDSKFATAAPAGRSVTSAVSPSGSIAKAAGATGLSVGSTFGGGAGAAEGRSEDFSGDGLVDISGLEEQHEANKATVARKQQTVEHATSRTQIASVTPVANEVDVRQLRALNSEANSYRSGFLLSLAGLATAFMVGFFVLGARRRKPRPEREAKEPGRAA